MGFWAFFIIFASSAFFLHWYATNKALRFNAGIKEGSKLPSLPQYYGLFTLLWFIIPILSTFLIWTIFKPFLVDYLVIQKIPANLLNSFGGNPSLILSTVKAINLQNIFPGTKQELIDLAKYMNELKNSTSSLFYIAILFLGLIGSVIVITGIIASL